MTDLTPSLLPSLNAHALPGLDIDPRFIQPKYFDQSILNIPATICKWMGLPGFKGNVLHKDITSTFPNNATKVILLVIDGLSYQRFLEWKEEAQIWNRLINDGLLAPLTSVVPSTTSSSLTTLWTGSSPASHGIIGYEMWLKEYALVANMILHSPMTFKGDVPGSLKKAGFSPQGFLKLPTLGTHLRDHGCKPIAFSHFSIANSGLSQILMKDVDIYPFQTPASLCVSLRELIEKDRSEKLFCWVYWGELDGISHYYGPDDERAKAEFLHLSSALERFFLSHLSDRVRQDTLFILTSDHGQSYTPLNEHFLLKNHLELDRCLRMNPTCENRFASLYLYPGAEEQVRDYFARVFHNRFTLISRDDALQAGLFGPGHHHTDLVNRLGDLIAIAHDDAYLWWSNEDDFLLGRHGSLNPDDMLVPFLTGRP